MTSSENTAGGVRPRPVVDLLPRYAAGKPPVPVEGLVSYKLSSNENPLPPIPAVQQAIAAQTDFNRYPDPLSSKLRSALAGWDDDGPCTAIGHARGLDAAGAAFVNGTAAHGEDFDDTFEGGPIELIGPAETVHHAGLSPLGIRVPDALGEAVVGDRRAVAILPLGDAQIHAAPIAGSTVPCNGRVAESCA